MSTRHCPCLGARRVGGLASFDKRNLTLEGLKVQGEQRSSQWAGRVWPFLMSITSHGAVPHLVMAAIAIAAVVVLGREVEQHIRAMETWLSTLGPWGLAVFVVLFVVGTTFLIPDSILCVVAGALFGLGWGTLVVAVGALLAGALQFALARQLLRGRIQRVLAGRPALAAIQRAVIRDELRLQVLLRLTPINPAVVSYLLGAAGVRFRGFMLASMALHPTLFAEVYFGHAGKHMVRRVGGNTRTTVIEDLILVGGLGVCAVVLYLVSRMAGKALRDAVSETTAGENGG